ncbi:MAG: hypothetical protein KA166_07130 [Saprospiraceae bacterium]|nr:hypothetical protein [Saprospiraceae bacterium]
MRNRLCTVFIFLTVWIRIESQTNFTPGITISFQTGNYVLDHVEFYTSVDNVGPDHTGGFSLVMAGFKTKYYPEYQNLFLPGECHVSEETFHSWKVGLGQYQPVIRANFILTKGDLTYGITQYSLTYSGKEFLCGLAHKKINGRWYYLAFDENIELQPMIRFFSLANESFFVRLVNNPDSLFSDSLLFDKDHILHGQELISNHHTKYKRNALAASALNLIFEDPVQSTLPTRGQAFGDLATYFSKTAMAEDEMDYLLSLLQVSLPLDAISHFIDLSGISLEKILLDCPNALTQ